ncbi:MAG: hypothetical protein HUU34_09835 [Saprospiraceae bacterium]|nr:hypothetical protein [Saprospiraceae bacterium]
MSATKKIVITIAVGLTMTAIGLLFSYWINTQPVWVSINMIVDRDLLPTIPVQNIQIINFVETHGQELAPDYEGTVCTEFVIKVIEKFKNLTQEEKQLIRIITTEQLDSLIIMDAPIIKGVQTAIIRVWLQSDVAL